MSLVQSSAGVVVAGVDVGSTLTKAVVVDLGGRILSDAIVSTGADVGRAAARALAEAGAAVAVHGRTPAHVVATGYGRFRVGLGPDVVPEVACHGRGAAKLYPGLATLVDIGGQDTKVMRLDPTGRVLDFHLNDKCAAGTGRFLEGAAESLAIPLDDLAQLAASARRPVLVTSVCAVFAETEIAGLLADGHEPAEVAQGLCDAVASRVAALVARVGVREPVAVTGGVSRNAPVVAALARRLGVKLAVAPQAVLAGALGAALMAMDRVLGVGTEVPT